MLLIYVCLLMAFWIFELGVLLGCCSDWPYKMSNEMNHLLETLRDEGWSDQEINDIVNHIEIKDIVSYIKEETK